MSNTSFEGELLPLVADLLVNTASEQRTPRITRPLGETANGQHMSKITQPLAEIVNEQPIKKNTRPLVEHDLNSSEPNSIPERQEPMTPTDIPILTIDTLHKQPRFRANNRSHTSHDDAFFT